jgi:hypothetical protein
MKSLEKDIRETLHELQNETDEKVKGKCPAEEDLGLFLEGRLSQQERNRVLGHLSLCPHCLDIVSLEASLFGEQAPAAETLTTVPSEALARAKGLLKPIKEKPLFDLIVRLYHESLEVIHSALKPLPPVSQPAYATLRGAEKGKGLEPLRMEKSFDGISAEIELTASQKGLWNMQILLKEYREIAIPEGIRVTLKDLSMEKELQSAPARGGLAVFQELPTGEYAIEIKEKGITLGTVSLRLT